METAVITGKFELEAGKETYLPLSTGRGASCVRMVTIVRVIEVFTDEIGMVRTRVEVKG